MITYPNGFRILTDIEEVRAVLEPNGQLETDTLDFLNGDGIAFKIVYDQKKNEIYFLYE